MFIRIYLAINSERFGEQPHPQGLSAEAISALETHTITEGDFVEDQAPHCSICHNDMELVCIVNKIRCGHKFHKEFIARWL